MQKYNKLQEKHGFQNNQYRKLQNMQTEIICCFMHNFEMILLSNSNNKSIIWS